MKTTIPSSRELLNDPYYQNVEKRLSRVSLVLALGIISVAAFFASWSFLLSFSIGAVISYLNFSWMKQGVDRLMASFAGVQIQSPMEQGADGMDDAMKRSSEGGVRFQPYQVEAPPRELVLRSQIPSSRGVIFKYFLRYALIGGTLYAIFRFRFFDAKGAILGLLLFVAAVLFECIYLVIKTLLEERYGRT